MGATTGIQPIVNYVNGAHPITGVTLATDINRVDALLSLIPNPEAGAGSSGATAIPGGNVKTNTYLDEMSPGAAAQLRVELLALKAAVT